MIKKAQQGISIYFSILVVAVLLAIALGISTISVGQIRTIRDMSNSVLALYAADAGIEAVLYAHRGMDVCLPPGDPSYSGFLGNGTAYEVECNTAGPNCAGSYYCLESVGTYKDLQRAIEVRR